MIKCYHCKYEWNTTKKGGLPKVCCSCGRDWRWPSLWQRLSAAVEAFRCRPKGAPVHRVKPKVILPGGTDNPENPVGQEDITSPWSEK